MWRLKTPHKGEKYKTRFETNLFIIQGKYQGAVAIVDKIDTAIEDRLKVKHAQKKNKNKKTKTKKKKTKATITRTTITNELHSVRKQHIQFRNWYPCRWTNKSYSHEDNNNQWITLGA